MSPLARNPTAMLGMHDGGAMIERRAAMRAVFADMLTNPASRVAGDRLVELHARNVELFGWRDAEVLRHEAFSEAVEAAPVPVGEASDFGELDEAAP